MEVKKIFNNLGIHIVGPLLITPQVFEDSRGVFFENWNKNKIDKLIGPKNFLQDNLSISKKNVLRGLHYQLNPYAQSKLISTINGSIFDVLVDLRKSSPTYKKWAGINLNSQNKNILWIPSGFAHGFLSLEDNTIVNYKVDNYWNKKFERSLAWNDKLIEIDWPIKDSLQKLPNLSQKDSQSPSFNEIEMSGDIFK